MYLTVTGIHPTKLTDVRTRIIVSIPIDLSSDPELSKLEEPGVRGLYAAVERIKELDDGKVEWRCAHSRAFTTGWSQTNCFSGHQDGNIFFPRRQYTEFYRSEPSAGPSVQRRSTIPEVVALRSEELLERCGEARAYAYGDSSCSGTPADCYMNTTSHSFFGSPVCIAVSRGA